MLTGGRKGNIGRYEEVFGNRETGCQGFMYFSIMGKLYD